MKKTLIVVVMLSVSAILIYLVGRIATWGYANYGVPFVVAAFFAMALYAYWYDKNFTERDLEERRKLRQTLDRLHPEDPTQ